MNKQYDITYENNRIGQVTVMKEGLYYSFQGTAERITQEICRLWAFVGSQKICLGIMIPKGSSYVLETKLPIKNFENDNFLFELKENKKIQKERWIPIYEDQPFLQLSEIKNARLQIRDRQPGVIWNRS